jgi:hypothetical protein
MVRREEVREGTFGATREARCRREVKRKQFAKKLAPEETNGTVLAAHSHHCCSWW